jgi:hypothetical protein
VICKLSLVFVIAAVSAPAQQAGDPDLRTRQLWDDSLLAKRPSGANAPATKRPASSLAKGALVGVTVWRLRPSKPSDTREIRSLIHEDDADQEWTPERVAADEPLKEGQRVRISTEAAQEGYLYIIDRDEYAGGTWSDPYLIFPTLRTRGGDNHVVPGMVVEIPSPDDNPPYFKVQRSRPDQIDEVLTILISPKPLAEVKIGRQRSKLSEEQFARWERLWKVKSSRLGDAAHEGAVYTPAEKEAGHGGKLLTRGDPLPQIMYHLESRPGDAVMLDLPLRIAK